MIEHAPSAAQMVECARDCRSTRGALGTGLAGPDLGSLVQARETYISTHSTPEI
jgi:hypothetical protein